MSGIFNFWAQALDNDAADSIYWNGRLLSPIDETLRQQAVSFVSETALAGKKIYEQSGVVLTATKWAFVLELMPAQIDAVGRAAPVVCFGDISPNIADHEQSFMSQLEDFTASIRREVSGEQRALIVTAFRSIKKKTALGRDMSNFKFLIVGVCAVLSIIAVLYFKGNI